MSISKIGSSPNQTLPSPDRPEKAAPENVELGDLAAEMAELKDLLLKTDETARLARAQSQVEALLYAAQLSIARGEKAGLRGLASEAGRIARDLGRMGGGDVAAAIIAQAGQVTQLCESPMTSPTTPASPETE